MTSTKTNENDIKSNCLYIINTIKAKPESWPFVMPVNEEKDNAPNYYDQVKQPMDLMTLTQLIHDGVINDEKKFVLHLELIWSNAFDYNHSKHEVYKLAKKTQALAIDLIKECWSNKYDNIWEIFPWFRRSTRNRSKLGYVNMRISAITRENDNEKRMISKANGEQTQNNDGDREVSIKIETDDEDDDDHDTPMLKQLNAKICSLSNELIDIKNENDHLKQQNDNITKSFYETQDKLIDTYNNLAMIMNDLSKTIWNNNNKINYDEF